MFFSTSLAVFGLATLGQSHMIMNTPVPFGKSSLNNSPLDASGSDFPCKQRPGVYETEGASNTMALGSDQPLSFTGSAVHGGGSCQISITYDKAPTKNSVFKVIHSIEGGCPMRDIEGNNGDNANLVSPSTYSFKVPDNLPTGDAVLAWSWMNKIGNREMYMNCAPITITAGTSKRSDEDALIARNVTQLLERDVASFNGLPDMFVANIGNGCKTDDSKNVIYPNPGSSVEKNGLTDSNSGAPIGSCGNAAGSPNAPSPSAAPTSASPAESGPATTAAPTQSSAAGLPGGVFITVAPPGSGSGNGGETQPKPSTAPVVPSAPVESPSAPAPSSPPVEAPSAVPSIAPTPIAPVSPPAGTGTTGSGSALSGPCTTEGQWNCIGGTSFQQCGSGTWSVVMQLAAGTKCKPGQSAVIDISAIGRKRRAIRFSHEHFRRHIRSSS